MNAFRLYFRLAGRSVWVVRRLTHACLGFSHCSGPLFAFFELLVLGVLRLLGTSDGSATGRIALPSVFVARGLHATLFTARSHAHCTGKR